ncbi:MAG: DUF5698 domain-containing protein [Sphaerochaetaceae bacterium]
MDRIAEFLTGKTIYVYLFVFFGKLLEVALASLRSQLIHKGERLLGGIVAVFEYTFWLTITATVITGFADDLIKMLVLIAAFATGNVLGSFLEEKLALGYVSISIVFMEKQNALQAADLLRSQGHALTIIPSQGINGAERTVLQLTVKRKYSTSIKSLIRTHFPQAVLSVSATQQIFGGTFAKAFK